MPNTKSSPDQRNRPRLILVNKPYRMLSQFRDDSGRATLGNLGLPPDVYPAGRLDYDSEGLLILTNHGPWQARISHPRHKMAKTYWVQVEGAPNSPARQRLLSGVQLKDGPARAMEAYLIDQPDGLWPRDPPIRHRRHIPTHWLALTLIEGRNRQVRRMTAAVGLPTLRLIRARIGPWELSGLLPGQWREITPPADFVAATGVSRKPTGYRPHAGRTRRRPRRG